ncbi:hypothetical protein BDZ88DRAFT_414053 [Geranomyces variabilis]|nr:hypothetical protein BDZ88DRAFT_414053 [Geranomyces variabilis]KAJ3137872.1 hypothetical protein HDU90_001823 [Geranomyces variabilis]
MTFVTRAPRRRPNTRPTRRLPSCCSCIPLRIGLCVIALLVAAGNAAEIWRNLNSRSNYPDSMLKLWSPFQWINIVFSGCAIAGALLGLAGLLTNSRPLVIIFARVEQATVWFNIVRAIAISIAISLGRDTFVAYCRQRNPLTANDCSNAVTWAIVTTALISLAGALFAHVSYRLISAYAEQLLDRRGGGGGGGGSSASMAPYAVLDEERGLAPPPPPPPADYHHHQQPPKDTLSPPAMTAAAAQGWPRRPPPPPPLLDDLDDDRAQAPSLGGAYSPRDAKSFDSVRLSSDEPRGDAGDLSSPERIRRYGS